jgi:hypothetical protein
VIRTVVDRLEDTHPVDTPTLDARCWVDAIVIGRALRRRRRRRRRLEETHPVDTPTLAALWIDAIVVGSALGQRLEETHPVDTPTLAALWIDALVIGLALRRRRRRRRLEETHPVDTPTLVARWVDAIVVGLALQRWRRRRRLNRHAHAPAVRGEWAVGVAVIVLVGTRAHRVGACRHAEVPGRTIAVIDTPVRIRYTDGLAGAVTERIGGNIAVRADRAKHFAVLAVGTDKARAWIHRPRQADPHAGSRLRAVGPTGISAINGEIPAMARAVHIRRTISIREALDVARHTGAGSRIRRRVAIVVVRKCTDKARRAVVV